MNKKVKIFIPVIIAVLVVVAGVCVILNNTKETSSNQSENLTQDISQIEEINIVEENITNSVENNIIENVIENTDVENTYQDNVINVENVANDYAQTSNNILKEDSIAKENVMAKVLPNYDEIVYGTSENGRELVAYSIAPQEYENTILFVFAIHGYEDAYDKDGQVLVNTAKNLVEYYKTVDSGRLNNNRLLIIECANPDGLYDGYTNYGYGRCNAKGIDLNRDFDIIYKPFSSARNYTSKPFSGKESTALASLIKEEKPAVVIDFHGWENDTIGDGKLAKVFKENMSLTHKTEFNNNCNGFLSYWAHSQGADALLVEFKNENFSREDLKMAINEILDMY